LICGKREREEETPCKNQSDPFSLDDFAGMDENLILHIGMDCFHLPSLYDWIINRNHNTNPLTNYPFTNEQIEMIRNEGRNRFPFEIRIYHIFGPLRTIQTSSLISSESLLNLIEPDAHTLFQFMQVSVAHSKFYMVQIPGGGPEQLLPVFLDANHLIQLKDLGYNNHILIFLSRGDGPARTLEIYQAYRQVAENRNLPTDVFQEAIDRLTREKGAFRRAEQRAKEIRGRRRARDDANPEVRPPGTRHFRVQLNTRDGYSYGAVDVYPDVDGTLEMLDPLVRIKLENDIEVPNASMKFIYAGRMYRPETRFRDIAGLEDGRVIFVAF
jgi:hypothetical protein